MDLGVVTERAIVSVSYGLFFFAIAYICAKRLEMPLSNQRQKYMIIAAVIVGSMVDGVMAKPSIETFLGYLLAVAVSCLGVFLYFRGKPS